MLLVDICFRCRPLPFIACAAACQVFLGTCLDFQQPAEKALTALGARFFLGTWNMKGFLSEERPIRTLREVLQRLNDVYCSTIGYEVLLA